MRYRDKITVWRKTGTSAWFPPAIYSSNNSTKSEEFTDISGVTRMSKGACYTDADIKMGDVVYFGQSAQVEPVNDADDIRALSTAPTMSSSKYKKAWFA